MSQYDYLRERIRQNVWLGKDVLNISDQVFSVINTPKDWFYNLPPIKFILESENSPLSQLVDFLDEASDVPGIIRDCGLIFLETSYGINKAYNSKVHQNAQAAAAGQAIALLRTNQREISLYEGAVTAHNEALNLPILSKKADEIAAAMAEVGQIADTGSQLIQKWQQQAIQQISQAKDDLAKQLAELTGKARTKVQRQLNKLTKVIESMLSGTNKQSIRSIGYQTKSVGAIVPIAVGGLATVSGAINVVSAIATFLLSSMFLKAITDFPVQLLGGLVHATTSIVLKFFGSSGASAVRFYGAAALKTAAQVLPAMFSQTGMFGGAWAVLAAYAPFIIIAAIVIILAIKSTNTEVGPILYVFGTGFNDQPDMVFASSRRDIKKFTIKQVLSNLSKKLVNESGRNYPELYGFSLNEFNEVKLCLNLTGDRQNIEKSEVGKALFATRFAPFIEEFAL
jgi:chaperonin cofactor prefoldin